MTTKTTRTSSENVTPRFYKYFSIIPSRLAFKMSSYSLRIKLSWAALRLKKKIAIFCQVLTSTRLQNGTFYVVARPRTATKCTKMKNKKKHEEGVDNYFSSKLNVPICDVFVAVFWSAGYIIMLRRFGGNATSFQALSLLVLQWPGFVFTSCSPWMGKNSNLFLYLQQFGAKTTATATRAIFK